MNVKYKLLIGAVLAAPFLMINVTSAQQNPARATAQNTETTESTQTTTETQPTAAEQQAAVKQRMDKRKNEVKATVSAAEKQRIQKNCKNAQGKLSSLRGRITGIETSRSQVYDNLVTRLKKVSEKAGTTAEGTELNAQIAELEEMITKFKLDIAEYKLLVSDMADSNCEQDPEAFKDALTLARESRKKVQADAAEIKQYVNETIKPTLTTIKQQKTEEQEGTE